jgi:hypothetical protein
VLRSVFSGLVEVGERALEVGRKIDQKPKWDPHLDLVQRSAFTFVACWCLSALLICFALAAVAPAGGWPLIIPSTPLPLMPLSTRYYITYTPRPPHCTGAVHCTAAASRRCRCRGSSSGAGVVTDFV